MNNEKLESAKNLFFIALYVDIAATAAVIAGNLWGLGILKDLDLGISSVDQFTLSTLNFFDYFSKVLFLTTICVGLTLVKWLNACYRYAKEDIGATGFKNESWTAIGWIIPIFNLFKPYQIISEIYRAGVPTYSITDDWKKENGSGLLLTWWIFWAVTHFIGWIASREIVKNSFRQDMTLQQSIGVVEGQIWFCFISLIIAGLWIVVAGNLTRRLLERNSLGGTRIESNHVELVRQQTSSMGSQVFQTNPATPVASVGAHRNEKKQTTSMRTSANADPVDEDSVYTIVAEEFENGTTDKGLWTRLFAECGGDEKQTKVLYIKRRAEKLIASENSSREQLALEVAERQRQLAIEAEKAEKTRRQKAGLADPILLAEVWHGNWSNVSKLLNEGVSPFGYDENGNSLLDLAIQRGDHQMTELLKSYGVDLMEQYGIKFDGEKYQYSEYRYQHFADAVRCAEKKTTDVVAKFKNGEALSIDDLIFLVDAATRNVDLIRMSDRVCDNTLLHLCAKRGLDSSVAILLEHKADASAVNREGKQPHELSSNASVVSILSNVVHETP